MKWIAIAFALSLAPSIPAVADAGRPTAVKAKSPRGKLPARVRRQIASGEIQIKRTFPDGVIVSEQAGGGRRFEPFLRAARPPVVYRANGTKPRIDTSSQESTAATIKQLVKTYDAKPQISSTVDPIKQALRAAGPKARAIIVGVSFGGGRTIKLGRNIETEADIYDLFTARRRGNDTFEFLEAGSGAPAVQDPFHITRSFGAPGAAPKEPNTSLVRSRPPGGTRLSRTQVVRNQPQEYHWFVVTD
jgi:hypothetical protein